MTVRAVSRVQLPPIPSQRHTTPSDMYPMTTIEPIPMRFLWEARSVDYAIELTLNAMSFYQNKVVPEGASQ